MRLDRARVPTLVAPPFLDVADEPREEAVPVAVCDELPLGGELVVGDGRRSAERRRQARLHRRPVERGIRRHHLVGQREQELLARAEMGHLDVDAAVGQHPARHVDRPRAVELPGQQLTPDGVTHVVAEERQLLDTQRVGERDHEVGLLRDPVGLVGLVGEPVPEQVEQQDPPVPPEVVEHVAEVERRAREAVEHEQRRFELGLERLGHDREHRMAGQWTMLAERGPLGDAQDRGPRTSAPGRASVSSPSSTTVSPATIVST